MITKVSKIIHLLNELPCIPGSLTSWSLSNLVNSSMQVSIAPSSTCKYLNITTNVIIHNILPKIQKFSTRLAFCVARVAVIVYMLHSDQNISPNARTETFTSSYDPIHNEKLSYHQKIHIISYNVKPVYH